jgi:hypothetical protein
MVLKGLAIGGSIVGVAIAIFAALTLRPAAPAPAMMLEQAPAVEMMVLPNGVAAPQLRLAEPAAAPALIDAGTTSLVGMDRANVDAGAALFSAEKPARAADVAEQAVLGCGGK